MGGKREQSECWCSAVLLVRVCVCVWQDLTKQVKGQLKEQGMVCVLCLSFSVKLCTDFALLCFALLLFPTN